VATALTEEQVIALDVARGMAAAGVPVFVAPPDPSHPTGFRLPAQWQKTQPDPAVIERWQPGDALCAVMGCGLDLLDVDSYKDPEAVRPILDDLPTIYGLAVTPSGGTHLFIRSLGVRSRDGLYPGIDLKGGTADGLGRGFAFIAPTIKPSRVTGEPSEYRWLRAPDGWLDAAADDSGASIAKRVREVRSSSGVRKPEGPDWLVKFLNNKEPQAQAAADRAIETKLAEVREWQAGGGGSFRTTLMRAAYTLGGYVGGGYLDEGLGTARTGLCLGLGEPGRGRPAVDRPRTLGWRDVAVLRLHAGGRGDLRGGGPRGGERHTRAQGDPAR
jgi:hypothetical protein